jgi:hypothetical protein
MRAILADSANRQAIYGPAAFYLKKIAVRIAKNHSFHTIELKYKQMPRLMVSMFLIVTDVHRGCGQEYSAKCQNL